MRTPKPLATPKAPSGSTLDDYKNSPRNRQRAERRAERAEYNQSRKLRQIGVGLLTVGTAVAVARVVAHNAIDDNVAPVEYLIHGTNLTVGAISTVIGGIKERALRHAK